MKLKYNIIKGIIITCFLWGGASLYAQGVFSNDDGGDNTTSALLQNDGGLFRNDDIPGSGDDDSGDTGDGKAHGGPGNDSPIGGGIVILSLLSGAYAMVRRNIKNKYED